MDNIFVNIAGDWKLAGFELTCRISEDLSLIKTHYKQIGEKYIPPELLSGNFVEILKNNQSNYDCWLLGCTLIQIFSGEFQGILFFILFFFFFSNFFFRCTINKEYQKCSKTTFK